MNILETITSNPYISIGIVIVIVAVLFFVLSKKSSGSEAEDPATPSETDKKLVLQETYLLELEDRILSLEERQRQMVASFSAPNAEVPAPKKKKTTPIITEDYKEAL